MPSLRLHQPVRFHHIFRQLVVICIICFSALYGPQIVMSSTMTQGGPISPCKPGEWQCGGSQSSDIHCISQNRFCDGIENCEDGSDEPLGCTNCNRTFIGEANIKYPIRVTGPFQRYLPFVCQISFVAAGKEYGDFVELTFLSFQIGALEFTRNQTPICQKGYLKVSEVPLHSSTGEYDKPASSSFFPPSSSVRGFPFHMDFKAESATNPEFGQFCGSLLERSVTYFSENNNVSVLAVVPSRASIPSSSFSLYLTYRFLLRKFQLPHKFPGEPFPYLGGSVPGSYCDRTFNDCSSPYRRCTIRSPNFPGFYPRNITCQYVVRQQHVPEGHIARIVLSQPNDYKLSVPTGRTSSTTGTNFLLSTDCVGGDIVRIYDGPTVRFPALLEFCGSGSLPEVISSGGQVLVQIYSAPYQLLRNSRVEIDIQVKFEEQDLPSSISHGSTGSSGRCSQTFLGSRQRVGLVRSPNHSMPKNADCTFRFIGASRFDRVWIYFVSFFSLMEKQATASGEEQETCSSKLELYDSNSIDIANDTGTPVHGTSDEPFASFCGDVSPKVCAHAADYPPMYLPPRPCDINTESYVSSGSEFVIRHRFLVPSSEVVTTTTSSFVARYEFVDTRQSGTTIEHTACDRRFDSRITKSGSLSNPRNVFLYGRGGKINISCMYHFVGLPSESVRITLRKVLLVMNDSSCKMSYDTVMQKPACNWLIPHTSPNLGLRAKNITYGSIHASEYWEGYSSSLGCLCNATIESRQPPLIFQSLVNNVKLTFTINRMSPLKDFDDYGFNIDFQFINSTTCERGLKQQVGAAGEGVLNFQVPNDVEHSLENSNHGPHLTRCRWLIEASPHKYLYLKFKGFNASSADNCQFGNKVLIYLDPRSKPVANACLDQHRVRPNEILEEFDIFSNTWYNDSHSAGDRDRLFVEIIANSNELAKKFELHWLEVTRPYVRTQSGQTLRNVDCLFECPEISACIDPELWCDGTIHCPSGYDESLNHCRTFPTAYVSSSVVGVIILILLIVWIVVRRRRFRRRLRKKDIRRLPQDDCLNMESPVG